MYAGHFAVALALKTVEPRTPSWALALAVGVLDILFGILVSLGVEASLPGGTLVLPWSHALLTVPIWALLFALPFRRAGRRAMLVLAAAVWSHLLLDLAVHRADIPVWPGSTTLLGFQSIFGGNAGWFEILVVALSCAWYARSATRDTSYGRSVSGSISVVLVCLVLEWTQ
jgi:membrane-bound metal-dependent hydrolase YbcI (DUF457 family)